ncbi:M23 family metallopeptidase [Sulfurimonas sp. MAG313]|nr:M23 family metallopeptidase [Sulfurimonas sp. MAG313]MDF1881639.1 M23 family metallopeptidase [Sulfurimonas sp. MAG313]
MFKASQSFESLAQIKVFSKDKKKIKKFLSNSKLLFKQGLLLDEKSNQKEIKRYLINLRKLQKQYDDIQKLYKQKLYKSIHEKSTEEFYSLVQVPLSFIRFDARLKENVVNFYNDHKLKSIPYLNHLSKDLALDIASYAYLDKMFQIHQEKQKVEVLENLDNFTPRAQLEKPVRVISVKSKGGFDIYLENNTYSDVTIKLQATNIVNIQASVSLPYIQSYPARSRTKVLHFTRIKANKSSRFQMQYSSILGKLNPNYNDNYLYALPYARGSSYTLTQGFNGKQTHKGRSAYALDFQMPIGSAVHAMRDGVVIAVESKHTEHGFSPEFASKANHIIIAHDDGSMAMYGHLNTDGVRVSLGDRVYKHQHIAYSGNTGYSSGPHLHVHISTLQSFSKGASSVPFKFKCKRGRIDSPIPKLQYMAI